MMWLHRLIRKLVYKMGFRPKPRSIFYSPSLDFQYAHAEMTKVIEEAWRETMKTMDGFDTVIYLPARLLYLNDPKEDGGTDGLST